MTSATCTTSSSHRVGVVDVLRLRDRVGRCSKPGNECLRHSLWPVGMKVQGPSRMQSPTFTSETAGLNDDPVCSIDEWCNASIHEWCTVPALMSGCSASIDEWVQCQH